MISVVYGFLWFYDLNSQFLVDDPQVAIALYMGIGVTLVLARLATKSPVTPLEYLLAGAGLVFISLTSVRTSVLALGVSLAVLVVLAPRTGRLLALAIAVASFVLSVGGAILIEKMRPSVSVVTTPIVPPVNVGKRYVSDDAGTSFLNGTLVRGDGARGTYARRLAILQPYVAGVTGLRPGRAYTVIFAVRPLSAVVTSGFVGDPTGLRWGQEYWRAAPETRWQFFRKTLRATQTTETLGLEELAGGEEVLFDAVRVLPGRVPGPSGDFVPQNPVLRRGKLEFDDRASAFVGGTVVGRTAAAGNYSRMLQRGERFELPALRGLRRGARYPIYFAVKPVGGSAASGVVGDPRGLHWGQASWRTSSAPTWHYFKRTLVATKRAEDLAIEELRGPRDVLVDVLGVGGGVKVPPSWHFSAAADPPAPPPPPPAKPAPAPPPAGPAPTIPAPKSQNPLAHEFSGILGGGDSNVKWRLAIWKFMLRRSLHAPILGVGFGTPTNFRWRDTVYDARTGSPSDPNYSTGPHNSFVNLLYRTGLLGVLALLAIMVIAFIRVWRALHTASLRRLSQAMLIGSSAAFAMAVGTAFFFVTLEGPYMGMFFWIFLALMLILPKTLAGTDEDQRDLTASR